MVHVDAGVCDHHDGAGAVETRLMREIAVDLRNALGEERFGQPVLVKFVKT